METTWIDVAKTFASNNSNIWLITTILLIVYIGIRKAQGLICYSKEKKPCEDTENDFQCKKLAQKDRTYLIVIMLIVAIFLISLSLYTNKEAMDLFSFTSTITSIILSVIAIILTITSETKNASTKEQLEKSAEQIKETTKVLKTASEKINPDLLQDIGEKITALDELMKEAIRKIEEAIENTKETRKAFEQHVFEGDPNAVKTNIPVELESVSISSDKYSKKEDGKDA